MRGYGLKGEVEGQLRVRERPSRPTTGTGELRVTGTYKAYGQNLTIDRGRLLFADRPERQFGKSGADRRERATTLLPSSETTEKIICPATDRYCGALPCRLRRILEH